MRKSVIQFRLDLIVRLIDTTTGMEISEHNMQLLRNGRKIENLTYKNGNYLFVNTGRENFRLRAIVNGYEEREVYVSYEQLEEKLPILEVYLLPKDNMAGGESILTMSGVLSGITSIEAVCMKTEGCCFKDFDCRKKIMTILNPHNLAMQKVHYAILDLEQEKYEPFTVVRNISATKLQIDHALESDYAVNLPIARVIYGQVDHQGKYLLRVRHDAEEAVYLLRYELHNEIKFLAVDFLERESIVLN